MAENNDLYKAYSILGSAGLLLSITVGVRKKRSIESEQEEINFLGMLLLL